MPLDWGCFLLGPSSLCYIGFGEVPEGSPASPVMPSQVAARKTEASLAPSPSSIAAFIPPWSQRDRRVPNTACGPLFVLTAPPFGPCLSLSPVHVGLSMSLFVWKQLPPLSDPTSRPGPPSGVSVSFLPVHCMCVTISPHPSSLLLPCCCCCLELLLPPC